MTQPEPLSVSDLETRLKHRIDSLEQRLHHCEQLQARSESAAQANAKPISISIGIGRRDGWIATRFGLTDSEIERENFWSGKAMETCNWASFVYLLVVLIASVLYISYGVSAATTVGSGRLVAFLLATLLSVAPPLFFWFEAKAFDVWVNHKFKSLDDQKSWRETYKLNAENGKATWAAVLLAVTAALLIK